MIVNLQKKIQIKALVFGVVSILFLVSLVALTLSKPPLYIAKTSKYSVSLLPVLKPSSNFPVLSAQGVFAYDLDSGVVLYEKNPDEPLLPASTTKIMTAIVAMEHYAQDDILNTGTFSAKGSKMGLYWNENISVRDLLYGLLVYSGNDAAEVLAANYPGGREAFISEMNKKTRELFAFNTSFVNPSGLDELGQITTAKDLSRIASRAMLKPEFASIVGTREYVARSSDGVFLHKLENRNLLLGEVPGVLGVKTGWTEGARENLVTYIQRDNRKIMVTVLGSQDRFGESKQLIEWIFNNYVWTDVSYLE